MLEISVPSVVCHTFKMSGKFDQEHLQFKYLKQYSNSSFIYLFLPVSVSEATLDTCSVQQPSGVPLIRGSKEGEVIRPKG